MKYSTLRGARGHLAGSAPNSNTMSTMVSPMGGNIRDKWWDYKVISTTMEVDFDDTGYGKNV